MSPNVNEALLNKIRKLLSLATSDNEHEAKLAATRVNELLIRNNISMDAVKEQQEFNKTILDENYGRLSTEDIFINSILCKYFFVSIINGWKDKAFSKKDKVTYILGEPTNIQIAGYTRQFLKIKFKDLFADYRKSTGCELSDRKTYYLGLYRGLCEQLEACRVKVVQEDSETNIRALIVVNKKLDSYVSIEFPRLKYSSTKVPVRNSSVLDDGVDDGKKIRINRGIEESGSDLKYLK